LGGRGRRISEFEASLVYRVSTRTARAIQRNPVSEKKKKKRKTIFTFSNLRGKAKRWWPTPLIPEPGRQKQEELINLVYRANSSYTEKPYLERGERGRDRKRNVMQ
jgi:hypothetical protein